jgi:hypothetical protein
VHMDKVRRTVFGNSAFYYMKNLMRTSNCRFEGSVLHFFISSSILLWSNVVILGYGNNNFIFGHILSYCAGTRLVLLVLQICIELLDIPVLCFFEFLLNFHKINFDAYWWNFAHNNARTLSYFIYKLDLLVRSKWTLKLCCLSHT